MRHTTLLDEKARVKGTTFLDLLDKGELKPREKVIVGKLVQVLPGGRKGIYESNVGLIKKPIAQ